MYNDRLPAIAADIQYCIIEELKNFYTENTKYVPKEYYNCAIWDLEFQLYLDEKTNRVYMFYELDGLTKHLFDPFKVYLRINSRLIENIRRDHHYIYLEIIGTTSNSLFYEDPRISKEVDSSPKWLRYDVISYWKTYDGVYRFIEDGNRMQRNEMQYLMKGGSIKELDKYIQDVRELNFKYDFEGQNSTDVPAAFEEYKKIYYDLFNDELKAIPTEDIYYSNFHIEYVEDVETNDFVIPQIVV